VDPFGDKRAELVEAIWVFDWVRDMLYSTKADQNRRSPLSLLRERPSRSTKPRTLSAASPANNGHGQSLSGPSLGAETSCLNPSHEIGQRHATGFCISVGHVLRHAYNDVTFRKLARAIFCFASMDN
jgi:hypothetical protein